MDRGSTSAPPHAACSHLHPHQPTPQTSPLAQSVRIAIIVALVSVGFNTLVLYAREPPRLVPKLLGILPAALVTALLWLKPVTVRPPQGGEGDAMPGTPCSVQARTHFSASCAAMAWTRPR